MDKNILKNQWSWIKEEAQDHWDDFSREEVEQINGEWNKLVRKLQEKYGYSRSEAEEEIEYFMSEIGEDEDDEDDYSYSYEESSYREDY